MPKQPPDPAAERLAALEGDARAEFALTLLLPRTRRDTLRSALGVLAKAPRPAARPLLTALFDHYARKGGAHDYGGYVRADIVRTLRPIALPDDAALLLRACATYEFPPPTFVEVGALLRATALAALVDVDESLARLEAARLLVDVHTDANSGEPALMAARALALFGERIVLYQFVTEVQRAQGEGSRGELAGECLRGLTQLPTPLLPLVIERYGDKAEPAARLGLYDLLLRHAQGPQAVDFLMREVQRAPLELARYLLLALVAAGNDALLAETVRTLGLVSEPARRAHAREALSLVATRADVRALLAGWPPAQR
jgi:hypothetical protein